MKALLVDDNTAPFPVEPANGTTPIQCTPGAAPSGGGSETAFVAVDVPVLAANEFTGVLGVDMTGRFSSPLLTTDNVWVNTFWVTTGVQAYAAAIEVTATDTIGVAVVAFSTGVAAPDQILISVTRTPQTP